MFSRIFSTACYLVVWLFILQGGINVAAGAKVHFKTESSQFVEPSTEMKKDVIVERQDAASNETTMCTVGYDAALTTFKTFEMDKNISFLAGESNKSVEITIKPDGKSTDNLKVVLTIQCTPGTLITTPKTHTITVSNRDAHIRCLNTSLEVDEGTKQHSLVVKKEGPINSNSSFWVETVDGKAYAKADYKPMNKEKYTFQPGFEYLTINLEIVDDDFEEGDETFNITLGADSKNVAVDKHCSSVVIKDNEADPDFTKEQLMEELSAKRQLVFILLAVGIAVLCLILIMLIVLVCKAKSKFGHSDKSQ